MGGTSGRPGRFHCPDCRSQFTVRTGQVMERSHIPLAKWVLGYRLMAASKKGVSAHQLHRTLNIAYNSAWFMAHRISEAMGQKDPAPLGGEGKIVEADEMYHGKRETPAQLSRGRIRKPTKKGLQRYLEEFTFRYNNRARLGIGDVEHAAIAAHSAEGKRLTP